MKGIIIVLLLVAHVVIVQSFTSFSNRWLLSSNTKLYSNAINISPKYLQLDEVCVGNLPSTYNTAQLSGVLHEHGISDYSNVEVSKYGTDDDVQYGRIKFASAKTASLAVKALRDVMPSVSLMPTMKSIVVTLPNDSLMACLIEILNNDKNVWHAKMKYDKVCKLLIFCKSCPQTMRVVDSLSRIDWKGLRVKIDVCQDTYGLTVYNLHPSITAKIFNDVVNELLGVGEYRSISVSPSTKGKWYS